MIDYVVGPMPAKDFLEFLPLDSDFLESPPSFSKKLFAKLASRKTEAQMYEPFLRIPCSFLSIDSLNLGLGYQKNLPKLSRYRYFQFSNDDLLRDGF